MVTVKAECLDVALWKIDGAAFVLNYCELFYIRNLPVVAKDKVFLLDTACFRALGILTDGLRNSWQGYGAIAYVLIPSWSMNPFI